MKLCEIFDDLERSQPEVDWTRGYGYGKTGLFDVNGITYIIQFIKVHEGDMIHGAFKDAPITDNTWYFAFGSRDPKTGAIYQSGTLKSKSSIAVISAVLSLLVEFQQKNNVDMFVYGGEKNDASRISTYAALTKRLISKYGWKIVYESDANFEGFYTHNWFVQKA